MTAKPTARRGLAIVPALVCLVLVTLLCGAMLRQAHTQRGLARDEQRRMQAEWLAESGLARASARLAADPGYQGETWEIPARALGGPSSGVVRIKVVPGGGRPTRRRVRVEADFPREDVHRARLSKQLTIDLEPENKGGPST